MPTMGQGDGYYKQNKHTGKKMSLPSESLVTCRTQIANQKKEAEGAEEKG